jgi:hypothetical protein
MKDGGDLFVCAGVWVTGGEGLGGIEEVGSSEIRRGTVRSVHCVML